MHELERVAPVRRYRNRLVSHTRSGGAFRVVVRSRSAAGGASLWASAGVLAGNACYFALSALGLGAVLLASHEVFTLIKYLGALYLVYLGVQTVRGAGTRASAGSAHGKNGVR